MFRFVSFAEDELNNKVSFKQHNISATQALAMSDWLLDVDSRVGEAIKVAKERGFCASGDAVIVVTGWVEKIISFSCFFSLTRRKIVKIFCFVFSVLVSVRRTLFV